MLSSKVLYNGQPHTSDEFDARKTEAALNAVLTVRNGASLPAAHRSVVRGPSAGAVKPNDYPIANGFSEGAKVGLRPGAEAELRDGNKFSHFNGQAEGSA